MSNFSYQYENQRCDWPRDLMFMPNDTLREQEKAGMHVPIPWDCTESQETVGRVKQDAH